MLTFNQLDEQAKKRAISEYIDGWNFTHDELLNSTEVEEILSNNDDMYELDGTFIDDVTL
jgi:flagellar capping protein FliD